MAALLKKHIAILSFIFGISISTILTSFWTFSSSWSLVKQQKDDFLIDIDNPTNDENTNKERIDYNNIKDGGLKYTRQTHIFGQVHMTKTGGTSLNGELALNYERVCGHKGWSTDAYNTNERVRKRAEKNKNRTRTNAKDWRKVRDSYTLANKARAKSRDNLFSRGRVPKWIGDEIGYHDCDYIIEERPSEFWMQFNDFHNSTMELHVPCRDPISHLMSMCNHAGRSFNCTNPDYRTEAQRCFLAGVRSRFKKDLLNLENIHVKCYDYKEQFKGYMEYITPLLQKKRIQSEYVHRDSNSARDKDSECIWKEPDLQKKVASFLVEDVEYYSFCDECLGSADDLLQKSDVSDSDDNDDYNASPRDDEPPQWDSLSDDDSE